MKKRLYDEFMKLLIAANDETVTEAEHRSRVEYLHGWKQGVFDAAGHRFNGDFYYIKLFDRGEMAERPICAGEFLDWKCKK